MTKPRLRLLQILNLNVGFMGIQFGWVMLHLLQNNRSWGVAFGGACFLLAAALCLRLRTPMPRTQ